MRLPLARSLVVAALALAAAGAFAVASISGSVNVSLSDGSTAADDHVFTDPLDVFVYGTGLPEGEYYVHIRDTQSNDILGTSVGASDETPVVVGSDGNLADLYQVWSLVLKTSDGTQGFDLIGSDWCEYRICVSCTADFKDEDTVTDLFNLCPEDEHDTGSICVKKFYDANANGVRDDGEAFIEGWKVDFSGDDGSSGTVFTTDTSEYAVGGYTFTEATPDGDHWIATTDTEVSVTLGAGDELTVEFGNVCIGGGGGLTPGFWHNQNGQALITSSDLSALSALHLVKASGSGFNPGSKGALATWLLNSDATNMAYKLSAHLAAMTLNVRHGFVDGDALVYAPGVGNTGVGDDYISVSDLLAAAEAALTADGYTPSGDANRAYQEALKNALDGANNDLSFVQSEACDFSF